MYVSRDVQNIGECERLNLTLKNLTALEIQSCV